MSSSPLIRVKRWRFRWSLRTLILMVAVAAVGFFAVEQVRQRQPVNRLVRALQRGDVPARQQAASLLGQLVPRAESAVPALKAATRDPDAQVRASAIGSLLRIVGTKEMGLEPFLIKGLDDPNVSVRLAALDALDKTGARSPSVVGALVRETMSGRRLLAQSGKLIGMVLTPDADELLWKINPPPSSLVPPIEAAWKGAPVEGRRRIGWMLIKYAGSHDPHSPDLARAALLLIQDDQPAIRQSGIRLCLSLDRKARIEAAASLLRRLREVFRPDASVTELVKAAALGWDLIALGPEGERILSILSDAMTSDDDRLRFVAFLLAAWLGPKAEPLVPEIVESMMRPQEGAEALKVFRREFHDASEKPVLVRGIRNSWFITDHFRGTPIEAGIYLLSNLDTDATRVAVESLRAILLDDDPDRRKRAAEALGVLGPAAAASIPDLRAALERRDPQGPTSRDGFGPVVAWALGTIGSDGDPRAVSVLTGLLKDEDPFASRRAVKSLSKLGPKARSAYPALVEALRADDPALRPLAVRAISSLEMPPETVIPLFTRLLEDPDGSVRGAAAKGLAKAGLPARGSLPAVVSMLRDRDESERWRATEALGFFGPVAEPALPALLSALGDESMAVRVSARKAVEKIVPAMEDSGERPTDRALGSAAVMDRSASRALELVQSIDALQRRRAAVDLALAYERDDQAVLEALQALLHDDNASVRATAAAALGVLGGAVRPASVDLIEAAEDDDIEVRIASLTALARVAPEAAETGSTLRAALDDPEKPVRQAARTALKSMGARALGSESARQTQGR